VTALWTLIPAGAAAGVISVLVVHWTTKPVAIRRATNLILAHMLEFRLFLDEPRVVLQAQLNLLRANLQLLRLMLLPAVILALPSIALMAYLNATYSRAPLKVGEAVVVSAKGFSTQLKMPAGITIETPPVRSRVRSQEETAWRVRPRAIVPADRFDKGLVIPFPPARILDLPWEAWFALAFIIAVAGTQCWQ
jgi:hypothetical protein